ncbi:WD40 repeat-like protein [Clavulina sp. PMI_390]|nr:WD40 repeat-like protein [Clavulina sp. PMI_390]
MSRFGKPHNHPSEVYCLKTCPADAGADLLAVGGDLFLEILRQAQPTYILLSSIHLGARVTAIAWSPRTRSPLFSEEWFIELVVACSDQKMRLVQVSPEQEEPLVSMFGNLASGHRGPINDVCFCIAGQEQGKYVASVGDDRTCILWDLYPSPDEDLERADGSIRISATPMGGQLEESRSSPRETPPPVAYPIPLTHPLNTVCSHPSNARNILVSDANGTLSVLNWMELDEDIIGDGNNSLEEIPHIWRGHRVAEFVDPGYLGRTAQGMSSPWGGGASWKPSDPNVFGATYGGQWHVWDQRSMNGGKPLESGEAFPEGGHRFRWCPTNSRLFAVSTNVASAGAVIKVFDINFPKCESLVLNLGNRPNRIRDFDWIGTPSQDSYDSPAWMAVAIGRTVVFMATGTL